MALEINDLMALDVLKDRDKVYCIRSYFGL